MSAIMDPTTGQILSLLFFEDLINGNLGMLLQNLDHQSIVRPSLETKHFECHVSDLPKKQATVAANEHPCSDDSFLSQLKDCKYYNIMVRLNFASSIVVLVIYF